MGELALQDVESGSCKASRHNTTLTELLQLRTCPKFACKLAPSFTGGRRQRTRQDRTWQNVITQSVQGSVAQSPARPKRLTTHGRKHLTSNVPGSLTRQKRAPSKVHIQIARPSTGIEISSENDNFRVVDSFDRNACGFVEQQRTSFRNNLPFK